MAFRRRGGRRRFTRSRGRRRFKSGGRGRSRNRSLRSGIRAGYRM